MKVRLAATLTIALTGLLAVLTSSPVLAQAPRAKNVLVIHLGAESFPANPLIDRGIHDAFVAHPEVPISYYAEYFELEPPLVSAGLDKPFKDYLRGKFAGTPIDVVIANSDRVLRFALTYRAELFPNAPIVFWSLRVPDAATRNAGPGLAGVQIGANFAPTLQLALALQPELRQVFVIANNPDPLSTSAARRVLEQVSGVKLTYLEA